LLTPCYDLIFNYYNKVIKKIDAIKHLLVGIGR
jgi:hypothetical protein